MISRREYMKKQASAIFGRSHVKSAVLALLLFGLLGLVPFLARSHGQSEGGTPPTGRGGPVGVVTSSKNPLQIALLHWYNANLTTQFTAGTSPFGVVFDGANIWVAANGSRKVTKLRANDGFNLGSFSVGTNPTGVAFDGANIWVANISSNNVTKLQASNGAVVGTFAVGTQPVGIAGNLSCRCGL
jgi:DNA-binding beta-propeller fold protein YncE